MILKTAVSENEALNYRLFVGTGKRRLTGGITLHFFNINSAGMRPPGRWRRYKPLLSLVPFCCVWLKAGLSPIMAA